MRNNVWKMFVSALYYEVERVYTLTTLHRYLAILYCVYDAAINPAATISFLEYKDV